MVVTAIMLVVLEHWWVRAGVTLLTAPVLLMILYGMAEVMQPKSIGEASLAFAGPVIVHWGVVPATGLLKLLLRQRAGLSNRTLIEAQRAHFAPAIDALTTARDEIDLVDRWRMESARAVARFLDGALHDQPDDQP